MPDAPKDASDLKARIDHDLPTLPLRPDAGVVTLEIVSRLRDEDAGAPSVLP